MRVLSRKHGIISKNRRQINSSSLTEYPVARLNGFTITTFIHSLYRDKNRSFEIYLFFTAHVIVTG